MIYNNLISQDKIIDKIKSYSQTKKIPHAFLFHGSQGIGKLAYAIEFSAALLCDNVTDGLACGLCRSCVKIKKNQHENINFIHSLPKKGSLNKNTSISKVLNDSLVKKINTKFSEILKDPYVEFEIEKANTILINSIREIKKSTALSNINNKYNIFIIIQSEKLCFPRQESANALLKILEEPTNNSIFFLVTSNFSQILDTIKSRCAKIYFPKISAVKIQDYLISLNDIEEDVVKEISMISSGNVILAKSLLNTYSESKNQLIEFLDILDKQDLNKWLKLVGAINNQKKVNLMINLFQIFILDIISISNGRKIKLNSMKNLLNQYIEKFNVANWFEFDKIIHSYYNQLQRNVYLPLIQISFFIESIRLLKNQPIYNNISINE